MPVYSAGLLMFNNSEKEIKVFLVHPGGPFFVKKDDGYWGIPKGLIEKDEDHLDAAKREFEEETGIKPDGEFISLGTTTQNNNKIVYAWAFETALTGQFQITCNTFEMEWPPHSGKNQKFPEVDKGEFFNMEVAKKKVYSAQTIFLDRLSEYLKNNKK
ncbi:MAG TPA: NUDIX domain-containing protein [Ignavibacteriaceae bacterium]|nr:NUDIX domain-containing protein [Ignavibacteriaceae bacterium]